MREYSPNPGLSPAQQIETFEPKSDKLHARALTEDRLRDEAQTATRPMSVEEKLAARHALLFASEAKDINENESFTEQYEQFKKHLSPSEQGDAFALYQTYQEDKLAHNSTLTGTDTIGQTYAPRYDAPVIIHAPRLEEEASPAEPEVTRRERYKATIKILGGLILPRVIEQRLAKYNSSNDDDEMPRMYDKAEVGATTEYSGKTYKEGMEDIVVGRQLDSGDYLVGVFINDKHMGDRLVKEDKINQLFADNEEASS